MGICSYHESIKATTKICTTRIKEPLQFTKDEISKIIAIYVDNNTSVDFGNKYFVMLFVVFFFNIDIKHFASKQDRVIHIMEPINVFKHMIKWITNLTILSSPILVHKLSVSIFCLQLIVLLQINSLVSTNTWKSTYKCLPYLMINLWLLNFQWNILNAWRGREQKTINAKHRSYFNILPCIMPHSAQPTDPSKSCNKGS